MRRADAPRSDVPVVHAEGPSRETRERLNVGDVVYILADYKWHDGFCHVIGRTTPEVGGYNFACTPRVSHVGMTLTKTIGQTPTCLLCAAALTTTS